MTATYDYDTDDRRTKKTVDGVVTRTLWSGADELAELDASGNVLRRFVPDGTGAMDARLATVANTGEVYWLHTDHQGSVIATSDSAGQTVGVAAYSPFGEFGDGQSAPPQHSPFGYTGRQYDPETGLYQYRARYYSPRLGQFLSTDPVGTKDDPNLYLYVGLDPVNLTDPTGMFTQDPSWEGQEVRVFGITIGFGTVTVTHRGPDYLIPSRIQIPLPVLVPSGATTSEARSRNEGPLPEAEGRAHTRPRRGPQGQMAPEEGYTEYGPNDPTTGEPESTREYRGPNGIPHGPVQRPNVKDRPAQTDPQGVRRPGGEVVRPPREDERPQRPRD